MVSLLRIRVGAEANASRSSSFGFAEAIWAMLGCRLSQTKMLFTGTFLMLVLVSSVHVIVALAIGLHSARQVLYGVICGISAHAVNVLSLDTALPQSIVADNLPSESSSSKRIARGAGAGTFLLLPYFFSAGMILKFFPLTLKRHIVWTPQLGLDMIAVAVCAFVLVVKLYTPRTGYVRFESIV